jgi:hypothetical protein
MWWMAVFVSQLVDSRITPVAELLNKSPPRNIRQKIDYYGKLIHTSFSTILERIYTVFVKRQAALTLPLQFSAR